MSFGQHGSAFLDATANIFIPPTGFVVVAIQCLGATKFEKLKSEDENRFLNRTRAPHATATDTVDSGGAATLSRFINMDGDDVPTSRIGQSAFDSSGNFLAIVKGVGVREAGGLDASFIEFDRGITVTNGQVITFVSREEGAGGQSIDSNTTFPAGVTIFGRFTRVKLAADQGDDGVVLYLGPAQSYESRNPQ